MWLIIILLLLFIASRMKGGDQLISGIRSYARDVLKGSFILIIVLILIGSIGAAMLPERDYYPHETQADTITNAHPTKEFCYTGPDRNIYEKACERYYGRIPKTP
jgi:hypothetical protein